MPQLTTAPLLPRPSLPLADELRANAVHRPSTSTSADAGPETSLDRFAPARLTLPRARESTLAMLLPTRASQQSGDAFYAFIEEDLRAGAPLPPSPPVSQRTSDRSADAEVTSPPALDRSEGLDVAGLPDADAKLDAKVAARRIANRQGMDLDAVIDNVRQAREAGVDPARNNFLKKLGVVALVFLGTSVAIAAAVLTAPLTATVIAGFAVGGVLLTQLSADATCAYMVLKNARAEAQGKLPPYNLPMGGDAMGNLAFKLMSERLPLDARKNAAAHISFGLSQALMITGGVLSGQVVGIAASLVTTGLSTGLFFWGRSAQSQREVGLQNADGKAMQAFIEVGQALAKLNDESVQRTAEFDDELAFLDGIAGHLPDQNPTIDKLRGELGQESDTQKALGTKIQTVNADLLGSVERLALAVEEKTLLHPSGSVAIAIAATSTIGVAHGVGKSFGVPVVLPLVSLAQIAYAARTLHQCRGETVGLRALATSHADRVQALTLDFTEGTERIKQLQDLQTGSDASLQDLLDHYTAAMFA